MGPWTHLESVVSTEAVEAMLARDRAEWQALVRVLEARPGRSLHDPESPTWNSRDVYAHLARWMEQSTAHLEAALVHSSFAPVEGTDDEINARWQSEAQRLSLEEVPVLGDARFRTPNRGHRVGQARAVERPDVCHRQRRRRGALRGAPPLHCRLA